MGKRARSGGRLQIHRETLRGLSAESLERVAGGEGSDMQDPNPRTNAWTARRPNVVGLFEVVVLCAGGIE